MIIYHVVSGDERIESWGYYTTREKANTRCKRISQETNEKGKFLERLRIEEVTLDQNITESWEFKYRFHNVDIVFTFIGTQAEWERYNVIVQQTIIFVSKTLKGYQ